MKFCDLLRKKRKGNVAEFIAVFLFLMFMIVILSSCLNIYKVMLIKSKTDAEARKYLLVLEQKGELTEQNIKSIEADLKKYGLKNITVTFNLGLGKKTYGADVSIIIDADGIPADIGLIQSNKAWKKTFHFHAEQSSISKAAR